MRFEKQIYRSLNLHRDSTFTDPDTDPNTDLADPDSEISGSDPNPGLLYILKILEI